ncbi:MAG: SH3 domain-containing protein, partial [Firmicutes bacterium]|nr:SH3 domain-containing protein [Bacillota bacterium]
SSGTSVTVTSDSVNIRDSASTEGGLVGSASEGEVLTYLGSENGDGGVWYRVQTSDGSVGYIASWLCSEPN